MPIIVGIKYINTFKSIALLRISIPLAKSAKNTEVAQPISVNTPPSNTTLDKVLLLCSFNSISLSDILA